MGKFKFKRRKDWKAKFRKSETASSESNSVYLDNVPQSQIVKSEIGEISSEPPYEHLNMHERNIMVLDAANNIFDLSRHKWNEIRRKISSEQIRDLYEVVADVWHPKTNYDQLLPDPGVGLRAIYLGDIDYLGRNVFRFGLYSDEIFIVDPFHKPHTLQDRFNPLVLPEKFKADTLRILYFLLEIEPWIRAGMVTLIPDPGGFDFKLRDEAAKSASERIKSLQFSIEDMMEDSLSSKNDFRRFLLNLPRSEWASKAKELSPGISDEMIDEVCSAIEKERKSDPLALDQPMEGSGRQITTARAGLNLETTLYLTEELNAFPYTSLQTRWRELLSARDELPEVAEVWSPLTKSFQELDFTFLDNVDSRFAYEMRDSGRLSSFRSYLRRLWKTADEETSLSKIEVLAREYRDELSDEYRKAQAEWKQIDTDLIKWSGAALSGALVAGGFSLMPPTASALGGTTVGIFKLLESYRKRKQFREKIPMSVFIDLSTRTRKN